MLPSSFPNSLVVAEDEDGHQQRRQGDGVANSVNDVEPLENALKQKHSTLGRSETMDDRWPYEDSNTQQADKTRTHRERTHFLFDSLVRGQVAGAFGVVSPSAIGAGHKLPPPRCVAKAVGSSCRSEHSRNQKMRSSLQHCECMTQY